MKKKTVKKESLLEKLDKGELPPGQLKKAIKSFKKNVDRTLEKDNPVFPEGDTLLKSKFPKSWKSKT